MTLGMPKEGTMERVVLLRLMESGEAGISFLDFKQEGIGAEALDQIIENLRTGMYAAEGDDQLEKGD
jgi:hypothetical protein